MINITFNGADLAQAVPGLIFTGLTESGSQTREITTQTVPGRSGSRFLNSAYQSKSITATYLIQGTSKQITAAHDILMGLLTQEEGRLILGDEPDRFMKATVSEVTGSKIVFQCSDPFKYSTAERTVEARGTPGLYGEALEMTITNAGNVPAEVSYEIAFSDVPSAYLSIAGPYGAIEMGTRDAYWAEVPYSSEDLLKLSGGSALVSAGTLNGNGPPAGTLQTGRLGAGTAAGVSCLKLVQKGTNKDKWDGGSILYSIPKDSNSQLAKDFELSMRVRFTASTPSQQGIIYVLILDENRDVLIKWNVLMTGSARCDLYGGTQAGDYFGPLTWCPNPYGKLSPGTMKVHKKDSYIWIAVNDAKYEVWRNELADKRAAYIQIYMGTLENVVAEMSVESLTFRTDSLESFFHAGDTVEIDGSSTKIYLNGVFDPGLEVVGSKFFKADPGQTPIVIQSDRHGYISSAKATIRERWL